MDLIDGSVDAEDLMASLPKDPPSKTSSFANRNARLG